MPRFFFNVQDGGVDLLDEEGWDFSGPEEARAQAIITAGETLRDKGRKFWPGTEWSMQVTDEAGDIVCNLNFTARC
jgi:hypothetical protein